MALMLYDVLIPGNYFCDVIFTDIGQFPALGTEIYTGGLTVTTGGVMNTVIALRRLGVNVGWVGQVGDDFFSQFVMAEAQREGLDTSLIQRVPRPLQRLTVALSYPQDRAFVTYVDPAPTSVEMLAAAAESAQFRHAHFTGLQLDPQTPALLRRLRARGISISMDCQHRPVSVDEPLVQEVLGLVDIFMPNRAEAALLTGEDDLHAAARRFLALVPTLVIKDGGGGAYGWHNGQHLHAGAIAVDVRDTTGAGDVFNAGFLAARLAGHDFETCLRWGNVCGGLSTQGYGGTQTAPTLAELQARLAAAP
jgi:sugar/nucleoside kinase (ribokinase family)